MRCCHAAVISTATPLSTALPDKGSRSFSSSKSLRLTPGRSPATLRPGARADLVIFDPQRSWTEDAASFASRGRSTPLQGQRLKGQVMLTMVGGRIAFRREGFGVGTQAQRAASRLEGILDGEGE